MFMFLAKTSVDIIIIFCNAVSPWCFVRTWRVTL